MKKLGSALPLTTIVTGVALCFAAPAVAAPPILQILAPRPVDSNLDEQQVRHLDRLERMFSKIFGLDDLPLDARVEVQTTVWNTINGAHRPKRKDSDCLADRLIDWLMKLRVADNDATRVVELTAEFLGRDYLSQQAFEVYLSDLRRVLRRNAFSPDERHEFVDFLTKLIANAEPNEERIRERRRMQKRSTTASLDLALTAHG